MYFQAWRKYFDFLGVATRTEYWTFTLLNFAIFLVLFFGWYLTGTTDEDGVRALEWNVLGFVWLAFILLALIPSLAICVRRVRDATGSGFWAFIWFFPVLGPIIVLVLTLKPTEYR